MPTYAYTGESDGFYRVELDDTGHIVGDPVKVPIEEAVPYLIQDFVHGDMVEAPIVNGGEATHDHVSSGHFVDGVIRPVFNAVMDTPGLDFEEKMQALHRLYGDSPEIVRLVAGTFGTNVAQSIWGDRALRYTQNDTPPDTPAAVPSDVVAGVPATQGTGPLPAQPGPGTGTDPGSANGDAPATAESPQADSRTGGDPVILFSGQLYYQVTDLEVRARGLGFKLTRTYLNQMVYKGPLGYCWDHSYNLWLREEQELLPDGSTRNVVYRSNGQVRDDRYLQVVGAPVGELPPLSDFADATFEGPPGFFDRLEKSGGEYELEMVSGVTIHYNVRLQADSLVDTNGNTVTLDYDPDGRLTVVTDPVGKQFGFEYDELNRLRRVRDTEGKREIRYTFGDNGELEGVDVRADGEPPCETDYIYSGPDVPLDVQHNLIGVVNPLGQRTLEVVYGEDPGTREYNRVMWQRSESGELEYEYDRIVDASDSGIDPSVDPVNFPRTATSVRNRRGHVVEHHFNLQGNVVERLENLSVAGVETLLKASYRYNEDGLLIEEVHPDGGAVEYRYGREAFADAHGGDASGASPEERLSFGTLLRRVERPRSGLGETRRIVTEFTYTDFRRLASQRGPYYADPLLNEVPGQAVGAVSYQYDARGNLSEIDYPNVTLPTGGTQTIPPHRFTYDGHGSITDAEMGGVRTHYDYFPDALRSGFISQKIEDADGVARVTQFDVDSVGRLRGQTWPYGARDEFTWSGFDLVRTIRRADPGRTPVTVSYEYNTNRQLIAAAQEIRDQDDVPVAGAPLVSRRGYDEYGRLIEESAGPAADPSERARRYVFGLDNLPEREFDPRGVETRTLRDELGRVVETIRAPHEPEESRSRFAYNTAGELVALAGALGHTTMLVRDAFGRVRVMRDADGNEIERQYDAANRLTRQIVRGPHPETGAVVRWSEADFIFDAVGRLIRLDEHLFEPGGAAPDRLISTLQVYDPIGRLTELHDPTAAVWTADYDGLGRATRRRDPDGNELRWRYDDAAHLVEATGVFVGTDGAGAPVTHAVRMTVRLDARGFPKELIDALGNHTTINSDSRDLEGRRITPSGGTAWVERDVYGQVVRNFESTAGRSVSAALKYDPNGNLAELHDPGGNTTLWTWDRLNRLVQVQRGVAQKVCSYDTENRCTRVVDENGVALVRTFSPGGRLVTETPDLAGFVPPPDDPTYAIAPIAPVSYTYTPKGSVGQAVSGALSVTLRYDSLNRLVQDETNGVRVSIAHDDTGRRSGLTYPDGRNVVFAYTAAGRLRQVSETTPGLNYPGAAPPPGVRVLASASRVGDRITGLAFPACKVDFSYDAGRRVVGADWQASGGAVLLAERRLYGPTGPCLAEQLDDRLRNATFDERGQEVAAEDRVGTATIDVTPLAPAASTAGLSSTGQADEDALLPGPAGAFARSVTYSLDDNTNRTNVTEVPSSGAAPTNVVYTVGPLDQYRQVGTDAGLYDSAGNMIGVGARRFRFDSYNRLAEARSPGGTTQLTYDALGRLRSVQHSGSTVSLTCAGPDVIEWRSGGAPIGQVVPLRARGCHVAAGGADYTPLSDLSGSVRGWVDATGALAGRTEYDPFGRILARVGAAPAPVAFRGYWYDDVVGLYLLFARAYAPDLGRFLQRDPLGPVDGFNVYAYGHHAPSTFTDQWGFATNEIDWGTAGWEAAKTAGIGLGVGFAAGAAVAAGIVSAPFVLVVGGLALLGYGLYSFFKRSDEAFDAGMTDFTGRAALAAVGDTVGITGIVEGVRGRDALTDRRLESEERSGRLGRGVGGVVAIAAGGRAFRMGGSFSRGAINSGWINPETIISISRPSTLNPVVFGRAPVIAGRVPAVGAGSEVPPPSPAQQSPNQVLMGLRDEATALTRRIAADDLARGYSTTPQSFGSINDSIFKAYVLDAIADGRLPSTMRITPSSMNQPGIFGIDVWDSATGEGWDLMTATERSVLSHDAAYLGRSMPDGTTIGEVNPLVYLRSETPPAGQ